MSEAYYNTIDQLRRRYSSVENAKKVVEKAISILEKKAKIVEVVSPEIDYDAAAEEILTELMEVQKKGRMTNVDIMGVIIDMYLKREGFIKVGDEYQVTGIDGIYTCEIEFSSYANRFMFTRLKSTNEKSQHNTDKTVAHTFSKLPSLKSEHKTADINILVFQLKNLCTSLKPAWLSIQFDRTPSVSDAYDMEEVLSTTSVGSSNGDNLRV